MKKKRLLPYILSLLLFHNINAQPLQQNERCPDLKFTELFNSATTELQLSSLKGKIIIFDFWSIHCITCIKAFPKLDSLQKQFNDKIQIIPVSKESKQTIASFFEKRKKIRIPS